MENVLAQPTVSGMPPVLVVTPQPPPVTTADAQPPSATTAVSPLPSPVTTVNTQPLSASSPPTATVNVPASGAARLQTGIFGREDNARIQMDNLVKAGFSSTVEQRIVNGNEMWAVVVYAQDLSLTVGALRRAGFETFILR